MILYQLAVSLILIFAYSEDFKVLEVQNFRFIYAKELKDMAIYLSEISPELLKEMEVWMNTRIQGTIQVVISKETEFSSIQSSKPPEWALATAHPETNTIFLRPLIGRENLAQNLSKVYRHELAHLVFYHRLNGGRAPRWLEEGIAMQFSEEWSFSEFQNYLGIALGGNYIPFDRLEKNFPQSPEFARLAYLESKSMTDYLIDLLGKEGFQKWLDELKKKENWNKALEELSQKEFSKIEEEWLKEIRSRYRIIVGLTSSISLWFLITLLFLVAYIKKRAQARKMKMLWELEDGLGSKYNEDDEEIITH